MELTLKEKSQFIKRNLNINAISDKLSVSSVEWVGSHLSITTEFCAVDVKSDIIADAWIKEIKEIKILFGLFTVQETK